jgi:hypothetical protein
MVDGNEPHTNVVHIFYHFFFRRVEVLALHSHNYYVYEYTPPVAVGNAENISANFYDYSARTVPKKWATLR